MKDSYQTIANDIRVRSKIKKCKFITSIKNVNTVSEAEEFVAEISEEFSDATHNVYAFKIGLGDQAVTRCSDDGEPSGSSGPPALQAIEGEDLTNTAAVITRYFGGVKHGVGGLVRAYGGCVREAIREAGVKKKKRYIKVEVLISYELMGQVINELESYSGGVEDTSYDNKGAAITAYLKPSKFSSFKRKCSELTRGEAEVGKIEEVFE